MRINVVLGRFQCPGLTEGHEALFDYAAHHESPDRFVVMIGVSPVDGLTPENPLSYAQRLAYVQAYVSPETVILPVFNYPTNEEWSATLDATFERLFPGDDTVLYGGRQSFIPCYVGKHKTHEFASIDCPSGTAVRTGIKEQTDLNFTRGQIFAMQRQFPTSYQTVDIGVTRRLPKALGGYTTELLLIRRADTGVWALPGGFVDPKDSDLEQAARRELFEETAISAEGGASYVASFRIPDWRYRYSKHGVMTALFHVPYSFGGTQILATSANRDEVSEMKFCDMQEASRRVDSVHLPLVKAIADYTKVNLQAGSDVR